MQMLRFRSGLALLLSVVTLNVLGTEPGRPAVASPQGSPAAAAYAPIATKAASVGNFGASVSAAALAQMRGGTQITETMTLTGSVDHNTDNQVVTGFNLINGDAFSGAAGVPMVIQNSGNNVLIQNATNINVQFKP